MAFQSGWRGRAGALAGMAWAIAACSSGSGDSGASSGDFVTSYGNIWCPAITPCCTANGKTNDVGACKLFLSYAASSTTGKLDQAKANQCLSELQGWTCDQPQPDACDEVFVGSTAPGGACKVSSDCAPAATGKAKCHLSASSGSGTCKVTPPAAADQPCGANAETATEFYECDSDPGFYCDYTTSTCKARLAAGQACTTGSECVKDATCDYASQKCVALTPIGGDCSTIQCIETAYCDQGPHTCAAKKPVGSPCSSYDECLGACDVSTQKCTSTGVGSLCFTTK